jgi:aspartyl-tRNA(Asn)/glutamyl-tRNA(Gln) amidotransferase subunit A
MTLWRLSAAELGAAYRDGTTTPEAVLQATLDRLEDINPKINAVVTLDIAGARESGKLSAQRWRAGQPLGPLDGVPVTIKDNILMRGVRATWGSKLFADFVPDRDEAPVAHLRNAGAVLLGKTNVPEFTIHGYTDNALFGPTRNPWDLALTPGGSSGGAVAAVASGIGPLALCTDGGGSIRRPAAHTGLVGFKPSRGTVSRAHGFPAILHDFEVAGPVARTVEDIVLTLSVIADAQRQQPPAHENLTLLRVLYIPAFSNAPVDPGIMAAAADMAEALKSLGCHIERLDSFDMAAPIEKIWPIISQTGVAWLMAQHGNAYDRISPALAEVAIAGKNWSAADYLNALDTIKQVGQDFDALFEDFDVLLTPATAAMPWPAQDIYPPTIASQPVGQRGHAVFTPFANALGLPAISIPCRLWPQKLPAGFQLVGRWNEDARLLALAQEIEKRLLPPFRWPS